MFSSLLTLLTTKVKLPSSKVVLALVFSLGMLSAIPLMLNDVSYWSFVFGVSILSAVGLCVPNHLVHVSQSVIRKGFKFAFNLLLDLNLALPSQVEKVWRNLNDGISQILFLLVNVVPKVLASFSVIPSTVAFPKATALLSFRS
jgi:hypothetical protein